MTILHNEIAINAPVEKIWEALSNVEELEKYDPTVESSRATTAAKSGVGSVRKVRMQDGKNWFDEKCVVYQPTEALAYELTACSFPVHRLRHHYSFETRDGQTIVRQEMQYQMKFGFFGKILDTLIVRRQSDRGIKAFMAGLKAFVEK